MRLLLFAVAFLTLSGLAQSTPSWIALDGCRLSPGGYADGDSFHVTHKGKDYIFRLYYADAPETDKRHPERVREQAKYFKTSQARTLSAGARASAFTAKTLAAPFTVITKWEPARGESAQTRFFAIVKTPQGDLAELLVANGWARAYGAPADYPTAAKAKAFREYLKQIETSARKDKKGAWSTAKPFPRATPSPKKTATPDPAGDSINHGIFEALKESIDKTSR